jgi:hypothetical protein
MIQKANINTGTQRGLGPFLATVVGAVYRRLADGPEGVFWATATLRLAAGGSFLELAAPGSASGSAVVFELGVGGSAADSVESVSSSAELPVLSGIVQQ